MIEQNASRAIDEARTNTLDGNTGQELEFILSDVKNLIDALQIVNWQFSQEKIDRDTQLDTIRNSVIGIGDAMEARLKTVGL